MTWSPQLIDLTAPMTEETIIEFAGKMVEGDNPYKQLKLEYLRNWDSENGTVCRWTINDHFGTHLDAPYHIVQSGQTVDKVDINRLFGEAVVLDCSFANGRGITDEDLQKFDKDVQPGNIVLLFQGEQPAQPDEYVTKQTYVCPEAAAWLVKKGVKSVGTQAWSFEHFYEAIFVHDWYNKATPPPHWPAHTICLESNVYILEGVYNLDKILGKRVHFSALPLPVPGGSGSPVRAVAWEE